MKKKYIKIVTSFFAVLIFISSLYIVKVLYDMHISKAQSNLLNSVDIDEQTLEEKSFDEQDVKDVAPSKNERSLKVAELQKENSDIVGWIEIEGTNINYPVLQGNDNDFYMNHNYKKDYSLGGAIFLDKDYSWNPQSTNLLMYGHNMIDGSMFTNLLNYRNQAFYNEHSIVRFTTESSDEEFEIFSVFPSRTYYKNEQGVFRYYYFINANTADDYTNFVSNAKKASLYDTGISASYGEKLMTLSTCAYHTENGKFVVVAKKIKDLLS